MLLHIVNNENSYMENNVNSSKCGASQTQLLRVQATQGLNQYLCRTIYLFVSSTQYSLGLRLLLVMWPSVLEFMWFGRWWALLLCDKKTIQIDISFNVSRSLKLSLETNTFLSQHQKLVPLLMSISPSKYTWSLYPDMSVFEHADMKPIIKLRLLW